MPVYENTNMNIPEISVDNAVNQLKELYAGAVNAGASLKNIPTAFFWGPAGVGKSQGVRQLAEAVSEATGKRTCVTDIRLLLFSPVDLRGVPMADARKEFTNWLRPKIFDLDPSEDLINFLFLDELSAAPQSVQAAAYQLALDKKVGEHSLPDNCIVIAAGNRTTDQSVSFKMPKALCNRLMHFTIVPDFQSWRRWAINHDISPYVLGYLAFDRSKLCVTPESSDLAYPTPRSWEFASRILNVMQCPPRKAHILLSACLGSGTSVEFIHWSSVCENIPDPERILSGAEPNPPKYSPDVLSAVISSLSTALYERRKTLSDTSIRNACRYALHFPPDYQALFFTDLRSMDAIWSRVAPMDFMKDWLKKNKGF